VSRQWLVWYNNLETLIFFRPRAAVQSFRRWGPERWCTCRDHFSKWYLLIIDGYESIWFDHMIDASVDIEKIIIPRIFFSRLIDQFRFALTGNVRFMLKISAQNRKWADLDWPCKLFLLNETGMKLFVSFRTGEMNCKRQVRRKLFTWNKLTFVVCRELYFQPRWS